MSGTPSPGTSRPTHETCAACPTATTGGKCPVCGVQWYHDADGKMTGYRVELVEVRPGFAPHLAYRCRWCHNEWTESLERAKVSTRVPRCASCKRGDNIAIGWHHEPSVCGCPS